MISVRKRFNKRKLRVRNKISQRDNTLPRLSVFRSNNHIYAQIIDDNKRITLTSASTLEKKLSDKNSRNTDAANLVGKMIAERALSTGIKRVVFDRGGYLYHGRVKALADSVRDNGLEI